ncbi:MAG: primosomal protein N' [Deltaproteobacteria bacterium]|nr:primosomal protein N' [Candidatus Tharpella aukensis]
MLTSSSPLYAQVAFNLPLNTTFTYRVDDSAIIARLLVGKRVLAPFRNRLTSGYLVGWSEQCPPLKEGVVLQTLAAVVDEDPLFNQDHLAFYERAAHYYQTPFGEALHALLPSGLQYRQRRLLGLGEKALDQKTKTRSPLLAEVLNLLSAAGSLPLEELAKKLAVPVPLARLKARLANWVKQGWLVSEDQLLPPLVKAQVELIYEIVDKAAIIEALTSSKIEKNKRLQVLDFIAAGGFFSRRRFLSAFSGGSTWLRRWQDRGWLKASEIPKLRSLSSDDSAPLAIPRQAVTLTPAQEEIFVRINSTLVPKKFAPYLLHGVTGSGKTEIYIKLIAEVIGQGLGAIYLVPEIALTIELVDRLIHEFGPRVAVLHSGINAGERYDQWRRIAADKAQIVVGARSAVFAPLARPGIIVVDEEHEPSYKQESGFAYNGRDLALLRGQMTGCCVVLGSATPALISYHGAQAGRYELLSLPQRLDEKAMPAVEIIDLGKDQKNMFAWDGFSTRLLERMKAVFANGRQVMLFLNKRGFSRTLYCLNCGYMPECRLCSVHQTFHKSLELLVCHYCGGQQPVPEICPKCGGKRFFPLGIGIQKLEEGLAQHFPEARVLRLDRDATRRKGELGRIIEDFRQGKAEVLLGTQMLAKGHNFPMVDLVGVIFADLSLEMPEFTAPERTFQLLAQVAGRTGRGRDSSSGEVIIQTLQPEHYSVLTAAAHDYVSFYNQELESRRELGFPPFSYLANLRAVGPDEERVREFLKAVKELGLELLGQKSTGLHDAPPPIVLLGPVPSAIVKVQNRYRWNLLIKATQRTLLHNFLRQWRQQLSAPPPLSWRLDIDPQSFF